MSRELPYFKFYVNDWITGDITLEDYETQGLFINLCAYYWSKDCNIKLTNAKRKFKDAKPEAFQALIDSKIIKVDHDDTLIISFLNRQNTDREKVSKTNSNNGKKGGRPPKKKTEEKPTALILETETIPEGEAKKSNIEQNRIEQNIDDVLIPTPSAVFFTIKDFEERVLLGENEFSLLACRKTGRKLSELQELLESFILEQKATAKLTWQTEKDAKGHFMNWVNKQPKKTTQSHTFLPAN